VTAKLLRPAPPILMVGGAALLQMMPRDTGWFIADEFGGRFVFFLVGWYAAPHIFAYAAWVAHAVTLDDPLYHAIVDLPSGRAVGVASYLRIDPDAGSIEVGGLAFSPLLQRTRGATEAMYLMARHAFDTLGYRRYEWKCNALNAPSRRAARRLGFTFEGIFRQHMIVKGRSRDTAWFAMIDRDWPAIRTAFEAWLDPANFDAEGRQLTPLRTPSGAPVVVPAP